MLRASESAAASRPVRWPRLRTLRKTAAVSRVEMAKTGMPSGSSFARTPVPRAGSHATTRSGRSDTSASRLGSSPPPTEGRCCTAAWVS